LETPSGWYLGLVEIFPGLLAHYRTSSSAVNLYFYMTGLQPQIFLPRQSDIPFVS